MFGLENTKTLPYFLCIWAKLEVGNKMGYLLTSDQQTKGCRDMGKRGARAKCISPTFVIHCVNEARQTKGYGNMRPQFKIEIHTVLRNLFVDNVCVLHM